MQATITNPAPPDAAARTPSPRRPWATISAAVAIVTVLALIAVLVAQTRITYRQRDRAVAAEQSLVQARASFQDARADAAQLREANADLRAANGALREARAGLQARLGTRSERISGLRSNLLQARAHAKHAYRLAYADALAAAKSTLHRRAVALNQREQRIAARERDVAAREGAVAAVEKAQFGDGTWRLGSDIQAGTYRASGGSACYWARLSGFSGSFDDIIANGIGTAHPVVTIAPTDAGFSSQRCGTWTPA